MTAATDKPRIKILLVHRRTARTNDGKRAGVFYVVGEAALAAGGDPGGDPEDVTEVVYAKSKGLLGGARPGQVFVVDATDDAGSSVFTGTARYRQMWPDADVVTRWRAEDQTAVAALDLEDQADKDRKHDAVLECLAPLRRLYRQLPAPRRAHLLALVVERLVRP